MPYYKLFYHLVWATKQHLPLLTPEIEALGHGYLRNKAGHLGADMYALKGMQDPIMEITKRDR